MDERRPEAILPPEEIRSISDGVVNGELFSGGCSMSVTLDSRDEVEGSLFVGVKGENEDGSRFAREALKRGAAGAVVGPSAWDQVKGYVKSRSSFAILARDTTRFLGDLARIKRRALKGVTFIGITGSAGKTTTKDMVFAILSKCSDTFRNPGNFNNLIGLPLSLLMVREGDQYAVLELGSNMPGEVGRLTEISSPHVGLITNIGPAHLEGFGGLDGVREEKAELFARMGADSTAVINNDDLRVKSLASRHDGKKVYFGEREGDVTGSVRTLDAERMALGLEYGGELVGCVMNTPGIQFFRNALSSAAVALSLGIPKESLCAGLESFYTPEGRFQVHSLMGDIVVVNDTYNANPLSVEVSLDTVRSLYPGRKYIFVLGDMLELGDATRVSHMRMGKLASALKPEAIFAFGDLSKQLVEGVLESEFPEERCAHFSSKDELSRELIRRIVPGTVVLVKGSRLMKLELVVESLVRHFSLQGKTA